MNVLNVPDVERELTRVASHAIHPAAKQWVTSVPRNYLLSRLDEKDLISNFRVYNARKPGLDMPAPRELPDWAKDALNRGETLQWFDPIQVRRRPFWQMLEHIVNWFNSWPATDTRLPRLTRINFQTACNAASVWMTNISKNLWDFVKDKPPIVRTYEDGYHWVRLVTNLHFERESKLMNHCVGNGTYYNMYRRGDMEYYSLRDKHNNPHCTVECAVAHGSRTVCQCKGNSNRKAAPQYQRFIRRFFNDMGWSIRGDETYID
jgi:PcfJ-like protein